MTSSICRRWQNNPTMNSMCEKTHSKIPNSTPIPYKQAHGGVPLGIEVCGYCWGACVITRNLHSHIGITVAQGNTYVVLLMMALGVSLTNTRPGSCQKVCFGQVGGAMDGDEKPAFDQITNDSAICVRHCCTVGPLLSKIKCIGIVCFARDIVCL